MTGLAYKVGEFRYNYRRITGSNREVALFRLGFGGGQTLRKTQIQHNSSIQCLILSLIETDG